MFRSDASVSVPGHNPVGGWIVFVMPALLGLQVGLGMVAIDVDRIESGPLSSLVEFDIGRWAAELHALVFDILLGAITLHVLAALSIL